MLAHAWPRLEFDDDGVAGAFADEFVRPVRATASRTVDAWALLRGLLNPWRTISDQFAAILRRRLFGERRLDQLPTAPTFDFNATNLRNGARWLFSPNWMGDEHTGWVSDPQWSLATAVAAASAFPPFLSPLVLQVPDGDRPVLTDGGVFDDLSMEYVIDRCATVLVSDGGAQMEHASKVPRIWLGQAMRVLEVIDNRMRELRRRRLLDYFQDGEFDGAYWGAYSDIADFDVPDALDAPSEKVLDSPRSPVGSKPCPP